MLGHGGDLLIDTRNKLKRGYTLVTITECATEVTTYRLSRMIGVLSERENKPLARNPVINLFALQRKLGFEIRVYKEGEEYPSLIYQPGSFFPRPGGGISYARSGVINLDNLDEVDAQIMHQLPSSRGKTEQEVIAETWSKSMFPLASDIKTLQDGKKLYTIEQVFDALGPGVYYFPICRSALVPTQPSKVALQQTKSNAQQEELRQSLHRLDITPLGERVLNIDLSGLEGEGSTSTEGMGGNSSKSTKGGRGKRMKKRLTKRRKYGARRTTMRLV
jgi:hypothetical protein